MADNFGVILQKSLFDSLFLAPTVSKEMSQNAMKAVIIAVVCMLLYIWIRFRDIDFASGAILALMRYRHCISILRYSRSEMARFFCRVCMPTTLGCLHQQCLSPDRIREFAGAKQAIESR